MECAGKGRAAYGDSAMDRPKSVATRQHDGALGSRHRYGGAAQARAPSFAGDHDD
jgi:hypothetical protein